MDPLTNVLDSTLDVGPVPTSVIALILYSYSTPELRPESVAVIAVLPVLDMASAHPAPPMFLSILYDNIGDPPSFAGVTHVNTAFLVPSSPDFVCASVVGASGTFNVVVLTGVVHGPIPPRFSDAIR